MTTPRNDLAASAAARHPRGGTRTTSAAHRSNQAAAKRRRVLGAMVFGLITGCGPDQVVVGDWMIGTWGSLPEGVMTLGVLNFELTEDRRVVATRKMGCEGAEDVEVETGWEPDDADSLTIIPPEGADSVYGYPELRVHRESCDEVLLSGVLSDGDEFDEGSLHRGPICLAHLVTPPPDCPPDSVECDDTCETVLCAGAMSTCE